MNLLNIWISLKESIKDWVKSLEINTYLKELYEIEFQSIKCDNQVWIESEKSMRLNSAIDGLTFDYVDFFYYQFI